MKQLYKALSLKQPFANLVASGQKTIETRTWKTLYQGDLWILSSLKPAIIPAGCAVALVELVGCRPMREEDEPAACCSLYYGAWAWDLRNIRRCVPFRARGTLGVFDFSVDPDAVRWWPKEGGGIS